MLAAHMAQYADRVENFKQQFPDFDKYVGQDISIPLSVRDEILRQPNGPDIALFLGFAPDVSSSFVKCILSTRQSASRAFRRTWSARRFQAKEPITRRGNKTVIARKRFEPGSRRQ